MKAFVIFVMYGPGQPGHQFIDALAAAPALVAAELTAVGEADVAADAAVGAAVGAVAGAVVGALAVVEDEVVWVGVDGALELHAVISPPATAIRAIPPRNPRRLSLATSIELYLFPVG